MGGEESAWARGVADFDHEDRASANGLTVEAINHLGCFFAFLPGVPTGLVLNPVKFEARRKAATRVVREAARGAERSTIDRGDEHGFR